MKPRVSVVIVTYNRSKLLLETLSALDKQSADRALFEVIVVDDGSPDDTVQAVRAYHAGFSLRLVAQDHKGLAAGRNGGIKAAKGDLVAITDDDCLPDGTWIESIISAFDSNPDCLGIEGRVYTDSPRPLFSNAPENKNGGQFTGCNTHYRKAALESVGLYDPAFSFWREDSLMAFRILEKGRIVFDPKVLVYHPARRVKKTFLLRSLRFIQSDVRLLREFPAKAILFFGREYLKNMAFSLVTIGFLAAVAWELLHGGWLLGPGILAGLIVFKFAVHAASRPHSSKEAVQLVGLRILYDCLFPVFLAYYLVVVGVFAMQPKRTIF